VKYLSIDIESTGLDQDCHMIEFAMVPFDSEKGLEETLAREYLITCPSFDSLRPKLNSWVAENMSELIMRAHSSGMPLASFKSQFTEYLESSEVKSYFGDDPIVIFGKSLNAIDLPFLNRDLGWEFMRKYFSHRTCDLSCIGYALVDLGTLPIGCEGGSSLMNYFNMGDVAHTALEDAKNTAIMYLKILEKFSC
jgi:oligoribonuclease (3'-5' exoribonuclease)